MASWTHDGASCCQEAWVSGSSDLSSRGDEGNFSWELGEDAIRIMSRW